MASARTVPDPADATGFFTTVADRLLRSTFSFGITNIPVQTNGVFVYTPAVQRLLQVAANLRDAATTNFYPTVYRPMFFRDPAGNVFITGYQQVVSVTGLTDPQLSGSVSGPFDINALPYGASPNANVYGVPWIIGAKKYMPNFNQFYSFNTLEVARKLQFSRTSDTITWAGAGKSRYITNQMLVMSITNHMGFSFWNSYTSNYPGLSPVVVAQNFIQMRLSYGSYNYFLYTNFYFQSTPNPWLGSAWISSQNPASRQANPGSFITGTFDFPFVHEAALDLDQNGNLVNTGFTTESFNTNVTSLSIFPNFEEDTTNWFQAFILDNGHVLDYVQFAGPTQVRHLGDDLSDPPSTGLWSTNASGAGTGVNWGVQNQITASQTGLNIIADTWQDPPNMPAGLQGIKPAEAAMFKGFFTGEWSYNGKAYSNTNLVQQALYTPVRTVVSPTLWVANDPLVHYLSSDLNELVAELNNVTNGVAKSDDPLTPPVAYPQLAVIQDHYQPWGRNALMNGLVGVLHDNPDNASYNLAYRDPLVYSPDNWNFPATNCLPLFTLGQVHRGTPWQTIYLKATNLLDYVDSTQQNPIVGQNTWDNWTGDFNTSDANVMSPTSDWRLAALLTELFNTNDATQLQSVNTTPAGWLNLLNGVITETNSTASPGYYITPELDPFVMVSNSPQASFITIGLEQAKANEPGQRFGSAGDILSAPEISQLSPWLNRNNSISQNDQLDYGISDAAYEAIPSQLLPLLRPDSTGGIIFTNGGWSVQFSGSDAFSYELQSSANLTDWNIVNTNCPVQGMFSSPVAPPTTTHQFYRSVLRP